MTAPSVRSLVVVVGALVALAACGEVKSTVTDGPLAIDAAVDAPAIDAIDTDAPPGQVTLTVVRTGAATGTVTSTPAGIACGATCAGQYPIGTVVTLTAVADAGAVFAGWGGACAGTTTSCSVTLNAATAVNADFAVAQYPVTVVVSGNGSGTVTSTPAGITCPGPCTTLIAHGGMLTLSAMPAPGSTFLGWSGGACTGTGSCQLTVTAAATINASFALNNSLVVTKTGNGAGTVTSAPAGIACGADCAEAYAPGAVVTLTAAPAVGSTFTGWSGGGCGGTGTCVVTMTMSQMVAATFTLNQYLIQAARAGTGAGTVTSSPGGITCGNDCAELLNHGASITLTAVADASSTFTGWSGAGCSGTGTCTITATAPVTATATFTLRQLTLTVQLAGTGVGTVTSSPAGIACGTDCTQDYPAGTTVTLTASVVAGSGSSFTSWTGGCSGTSPTCTVTMTEATTVRAGFGLTGPGGALRFDGVNDLAVLAASPLFDTPIATVEAWVNLASAGGSGGAAVSLWGNGGLTDKYMLQFAGVGAPGVTARIATSGGGGNFTLAGSITTGAWVHLALVYDGSTFILYRNGVSIGNAFVAGNLVSTSAPLRLGIEDIALGSASFMSGQLDEVRVWSTARTAAQISASFGRLIAPGTPGLVAYYRFDEVTGQALLDSTNNDLHGVLGATSTAASDDPVRISSGAPVAP